jgi:hypothetical protein
MRGLFNQVGRGIVAAAVVVMLAVPAQARATDDQGWWASSKLVKAVKRLVVKTFGDGLIIPRP